MIGNPIMDISVEDPESVVLNKYKLELGQACLATPEQMPIYDELYAREDSLHICGGSALNSARAANFSGAKVAYAGCIGTDAKGDEVEKAIKDAGMTGIFARDAEAKTGTCAVVVVGKERTLCANLDACCKYPMSHLESHMVS